MYGDETDGHLIWQRELAAREPDGLPCPPGDAAPAVPAPSAAQSIANIALMKACPYRDPRTDCGCAGLARCGLGKGKDGIVNIQECIDCVSSRDFPEIPS